MYNCVLQPLVFCCFSRNILFNAIYDLLVSLFSLLPLQVYLLLYAIWTLTVLLSAFCYYFSRNINACMQFYNSFQLKLLTNEELIIPWPNQICNYKFLLLVEQPLLVCNTTSWLLLLKQYNCLVKLFSLCNWFNYLNIVATR